MTDPDDVTSDGDQPRGMPRRSALALGGLVGLSPMFDWSTPALAGTATPLADATGKRLRHGMTAQRNRPFNQGWKFFRGTAIGADSAGFDDVGWRTVDAPHDWRIEDLPDATATDGQITTDPAAWLVPTQFPVRIGPFDSVNGAGRSEAWTIGGEGWYRKHFTLEDYENGDHVEVHFDGVYHFSDMWINGHSLGFHPYGYDPISYDLTPFLNPTGDNVLAVRVRVTGTTTRWYPGAGIYRDVRLTTTRSVHIPVRGITASSYDVSPRRATVSVITDVANAADVDVHAQVRVLLLASSGHKAASRVTRPVLVGAGSVGSTRIDLSVPRPELWSIEHPNLYTVRAEVVVDGVVVDRDEVTTGVRSLSMTGAHGFLLNGKEVKMRGANIHHDNGALGTAAYPDAEDRKVRTLKAAGFNAIRTSHNPASTALLDACDHHGVVVLAEMFDKWDSTAANTYGAYFDDWWKRIVDAVIARDRNHPSIVIWSTGNEIGRPAANGDQAPSVAKYGRAIADRVRSLDATRPVTQGSAMGQAFFFTLPATAPDWGYLDLADAHYQNDLNVPGFHNSVLPLHDGHPEKALVIGEAWHQEIYDDWKSVIDHPWAIGTFSWTGWDYLGEAGAGQPRIFPIGSPPAPISLPNLPYPWITSYQGDHDLIGQPKPQLYWKRVVWGFSDLEMAVERPAPDGFEQRALVWSYYDELQSWTWPGREGNDMKVRVYTSGDDIALYLDGQEIARRSVTTADKQVVAFTVPYAPGHLTAVAKRNGRELGRKTFVTAGAPAKLRLTPEHRQLANEPGRLAHVLIEVLDKQNRLVPDAVNLIRVATDGPATLAGICSANPHYVDSYQQPRRWTYHGRALAILRATGKRGAVDLTATSDGLRGDTLRLS